jgi:hypothetical protein
MTFNTSQFMPTPKNSRAANQTTKERFLEELAGLDQRKANADKGLEMLTREERARIEARRTELKRLIRDIEATEFQSPVNSAAPHRQRGIKGARLTRVENCATPGYIKLVTYEPIPLAEQTEDQRHLRNELIAANAATTGKQLYMAVRRN